MQLVLKIITLQYFPTIELRLLLLTSIINSGKNYLYHHLTWNVRTDAELKLETSGVCTTVLR